MSSFRIVNQFLFCIGAHIFFSIVGVSVINLIVITAFWTEPVDLGGETLELSADGISVAARDGYNKGEDEPVEAMEFVHDLHFLPHDERELCAMRISFGHKSKGAQLAIPRSGSRSLCGGRSGGKDDLAEEWRD